MSIRNIFNLIRSQRFLSGSAKPDSFNINNMIRTETPTYPDWNLISNVSKAKVLSLSHKYSTGDISSGFVFPNLSSALLYQSSLHEEISELKIYELTKKYCDLEEKACHISSQPFFDVAYKNACDFSDRKKEIEETMSYMKWKYIHYSFTNIQLNAIILLNQHKCLYEQVPDALKTTLSPELIPMLQEVNNTLEIAMRKC